MITEPSQSQHDPIDQQVGAQLKALRLARRMTQAELAGALGVTFQQVQKYERGVNRLAASTLARAAAALGCTVADFYPKEKENSSPSESEALAELGGLFVRMQARQKEALLVMARALTEVRR